MRLELRRFCAVLSAICLCIVCDRAIAQLCSDIPVSISTSVPRTRLQLTNEMAKVTQMSVIAEFTAAREKKIMVSPAHASTVAEVVSFLGDDGNIKCSIEDHVIHIYEPIALESRNNALNYVFSNFSVPEDADTFVFRFRIRLSTEAFRDKSKRLFSGSDAGATPNDADKYKLIPERITNIEARKLLLRVGAKVPLIFAVEIQPAAQKGQQSAWDQSSKKLIFSVIR